MPVCAISLHNHQGSLAMKSRSLCVAFGEVFLFFPLEHSSVLRLSPTDGCSQWINSPAGNILIVVLSSPSSASPLLFTCSFSYHHHCCFIIIIIISSSSSSNNSSSIIVITIIIINNNSNYNNSNKNNNNNNKSLNTQAGKNVIIFCLKNNKTNK